MPNHENPLVSVKTITYNHAPYIRQCIEGVLMQKTIFPFELVIGEDCSTDGTREIVLDYAQEYPEIIRVITSESNVGVHNNSIRVNMACRGKYIALCEGDDFWTDPYKLQKKMDFLESNNTYSVCGHWVNNVDTHGNLYKKQDLTGRDCSEVFGIENAFSGPPIHTGSWMFRNNDIQQILRDTLDLLIMLHAWDDPMMLLLLTKGHGYCFQEFMGAYRIHPGGNWTKKTALLKRYEMLLFYYSLPRLIGDNYTDKMNQQIKAGEYDLAKILPYANFRTLIEFLRLSLRNELMPKRRIPVLMIRSLQYVMEEIIVRLWNVLRRIIGKLWINEKKRGSNEVN